MKARCDRCSTERELVPNPQRRLLHALPELRSPLEIVDPFTCVNCGSEIHCRVRFVSTDKHFAPTGPPQGEPAAERRSGRVYNIDGKAAMFLDYPAVSSPLSSPRETAELFPAHEGKLMGSRNVIDQYGNPDLMTAFSAEYLKQYLAIVPKGRLPRTMTEMMPALHLLVNAAELALKADLIRSNKPSAGHVLRTLYQQLEGGH